MRFGTTYELVSESATTSNSGILTSPLETAKSPIISPPTILNAPPTTFGSHEIPLYQFQPTSLLVKTVSSSKGNAASSCAEARVEATNC